MRDDKGKFIKGFKHAKESIEKIRASLLGRPVTEETKKKLSDSNKGKSHNFHHTAEWKKANSLLHKGKVYSVEVRKKMSKSKFGKNNPNWRGGLSTQYQLQRASMECKIWRTAVFERDGYTCIWCFKKGGWSKEEKKQIILNADHIKPFILYPELRFAIDNGRTLCEECHRKTDTYGSRVFKQTN